MRPQNSYKLIEDEDIESGSLSSYSRALAEGSRYTVTCTLHVVIT